MALDCSRKMWRENEEGSFIWNSFFLEIIVLYNYFKILYGYVLRKGLWLVWEVDFIKEYNFKYQQKYIIISIYYRINPFLKQSLLYIITIIFTPKINP